MRNDFILDASLALSWCYEDEETEEGLKILDSFGGGAVAHVPSLWHWEVNNNLAMAERSKRLTPAERRKKSFLLQRLPIEVDPHSPKMAWGATFALAVKHQLTVYDAAYLEMAQRFGLPLGSYDKSLKAAALKEGLRLII